MKKNIPIIIFFLILIAVVIIAISIVVSSYKENKAIIPDVKLKESLTIADMAKIKKEYEKDGKKEEFIGICEKLELAVANILLDGSVTNDNELAVKLDEINKILKTNDWTILGLEFPSYWIGNWVLDHKGILYFTFNNNNIKPDWVKDEDVAKYIK